MFEVQGAETNVAHLRNILRAYIQLGDLENAIDMSGRALETHAQDGEIWLLRADALQRTGQLDVKVNLDQEL